MDVSIAMQRGRSDFFWLSGSERVELCPLILTNFFPKIGGAELVIESDQSSKTISWNAYCGRDFEIEKICG